MKSSLQKAERAVEQAGNSTSNTASNFDLGQEYARLSKSRNKSSTPSGVKLPGTEPFVGVIIRASSIFDGWM